MSEFTSIVDKLVKVTSEQNTRKLATHIRLRSPSDKDLAYLAEVLARSGIVKNYSRVFTTADVASTGGPSSLSTLVSPLYLRAMGYHVPKLGVQGRPAGGIDVMAQIPGFQFRLSSKMLDRVLKRSGYAHFLADETFAPLDMKFFRLRQMVGAQAIPELTIASILAKKLAVGVRKSGLEVRVAPHGNLGTSWEIARENAKRFCRVAKLLEIDAVAILTDGRFPYQPYIGRSEALVALSQLFNDNACDQLRSHFNLCFALAVSSCQQKNHDRPSPKQLETVFAKHLTAQGSSLSAFTQKVERISSQTYISILSKQDGFVRIDIERLRAVMAEVQRVFVVPKTPFPDPCGVVLLVTQNSYVWKGDVLARVRVDRIDWKKLEPRLAKVISVVKEKSSFPVFEEIANA